MKNKILQEFLNSNIKIKSTEKLEQYIDYCIVNNQQDKIKFKTEHHHILPEKLFPLYKNIKTEYNWNGTHLTYENHYIAHSLLAEALDNSSMTAAIFFMHSLAKKHYSPYLLDEEIFASYRKEFSQSISKWYKDNPDKVKQKTIIRNKTMRIKDDKTGLDKYQTSARKRSNTIIEYEGELMLFGIKCQKVLTKFNKKEKIVNNILTTGYKENAVKRLKTMSKEVEFNGIMMSRTGVTGQKSTQTMNKVFVDINGKKTSIKEQKTKKASETKIRNGKFYVLKDINNNIIQERISRRDVVKITDALLRTTKEKYLGNKSNTRSRLINSGKEKLIGLYLEEIV